jgi:hypothetical protein
VNPEEILERVFGVEILVFSTYHYWDILGDAGGEISVSRVRVERKRTLVSVVELINLII